MKKLSFILLLLTFLPSISSAVQVDRTITFDVPTQYTDGSAMPVTSIDHYDVYCGSISGGYDSVPVVTIMAPNTQGVFKLDRTVDWYCAVKTVLIPAENSLVSGYSAEVLVSKTFVPGNPPTNIQIK